MVIHSLAAEKAVTDFFDGCLYKFFRKPSGAVQYKGGQLKRLLDQRWMGHLATVTIIGSVKDITSLLLETDTEHAYGTEFRMEASGLFSEPAFMFITFLVQKLLMLLDAPKKTFASRGHGPLEGAGTGGECVKKL